MKSALKTAWAFVKKWWWVVVAALFGVLAWVLRGSLDRKNRRLSSDKSRDTSSFAEVKDLAKKEVDRASEQLLIEKTRRDTKVEVKKEELESIDKDPQPDRRRKRLSKFLEENL